jgi:hypothetical protein
MAQLGLVAFPPVAEAAAPAGASGAEPLMGPAGGRSEALLLGGGNAGEAGTMAEATVRLKQEELDEADGGHNHDRAPPPAACSSSFSSASSVASASSTAADPQQHEHGAAAEEAGLIGSRGPFSRPGFIGKPGYQSRGTRRRLPRLFPSSLVVNAQRAEGLFQRHYTREREREQAQAAAGAGAGAELGTAMGASAVAGGEGAGAAAGLVGGEQPPPPPPQQQQQQLGVGMRRASRRQQQQQQQQTWEQGSVGSVNGGGVESQQESESSSSSSLSSSARGAAAVAAEEERRRTTRSRTGKGMMDDWIKVPVTVTARVGGSPPAGEMAAVDGVVYVSMENGRECRKSGSACLLACD